jgi:hypothetical protein
VKGVFGGSFAHRGRDSSPTVGGVFASGNRQAILGKHPFDDPRLCPRHHSRGVGHSEVLTGCKIFFLSTREASGGSANKVASEIPHTRDFASTGGADHLAQVSRASPEKIRARLLGALT